MNPDTTQEQTLKRYLLGEMSDNEREAVEERFISDDTLFDELRAIEDELYIEYAAGDLSGPERSAFEARFLRTREDRDRLAFADAFLEITGDIAAETRSPAAEDAREPSSLIRSIAAFLGLSGSSLQIGMAAAVVVMAVGLGFVALQNASLRREVAQFDAEQQRQKEELDRIVDEKTRQQSDLERQLADEQSRSQLDQRRIAEIEAERSRLQNEAEDARRKSEQLRPPSGRRPDAPGTSRSIIALALSPGRLVRGENGPDPSRITVTPATRQVQLTLSLKNVEPHPAYRVVIRSVDTDEAAFSSSDIKSRRGRVSVSVPAVRLDHADYEITLLGVTPDSKTEELTRYYFTVIK